MGGGHASGAPFGVEEGAGTATSVPQEYSWVGGTAVRGVPLPVTGRDIRQPCGQIVHRAVALRGTSPMAAAGYDWITRDFLKAN